MPPRKKAADPIALALAAAKPATKPARKTREPTVPVTVAERVDYIIGVSGAGKMPIQMLMQSSDELTETLAILKKKKIATDHISARLETEEERVQRTRR